MFFNKFTLLPCFYKKYVVLYIRYTETEALALDKKKKFRPFDLQRDGRGISKKEPLSESGLKRFFLTYGNNFGKIFYVNIFMVLGNFPLMFLLATLSGVTKNETLLPFSDLFQNLGFMFGTAADPTPFGMVLYSLEGLQNVVRVDTTWTYIFYGLAALTLFTFGVVNVGTAYILRNIAMGEPVFVWNDFWYALRRNWKQALPFGVFDLVVNGILIFNIATMIITESVFFTYMMFWCIVVIFLIYFIMRYYIYIQMVTFDLTVFKILKNALIFALLGFKRNLVATLGIMLLTIIEIVCVFGAGGILLPFGIALPFLILISTLAYMKVFAAYFKVKEIMIDPYQAEQPATTEESEAIMTDDVTEAERLAEVKRRNQN